MEPARRHSVMTACVLLELCATYFDCTSAGCCYRQAVRWQRRHGTHTRLISSKSIDSRRQVQTADTLGRVGEQELRREIALRLAAMP